MNGQNKKNTIKSLTVSIEKYRELIKNKQKSIETLKKEIKELNRNIKDCEDKQKKIFYEQLQKQIEVSWLKGDDVSIEQLSKMVEIGAKLKNKIDELNVEDIITAVDMLCEDKKEGYNKCK